MSSRLLVPLVWMTLAGCQCQCTNKVDLTRDGGRAGGAGGGPVGDGGMGGSGGSSAGGQGGNAGGGTADAGDGTNTVGIGPGSFTLDGGSGGLGSGVNINPMGHIILGVGSLDFGFMWVANNNQGWVSKYDTRTGRELGRYWATIPKDCANSPAGPPCAGGAFQPALTAGPGRHNPSRTAIDRFGNVWVANRATGQQGSVTKIANDQIDCVDRNGNGSIQTSRDLNNDGTISMTPADGEMIIPTNYSDPNQYDECVLFSTPVGGTGSDVAERAIAVSAGIEGSAGDVWVGNYRERRLYKLSTLTGQEIPVNAGGQTFIQLPADFGVYGAIVDSRQRLWAVHIGQARFALIDTQLGTLVQEVRAPGNLNCGAYALGIDGKDRVWVPGWGAGARACRYDHATGTWAAFDFTSARSQTGTPFAMGRGIAVDVQGTVYMSGYGGSTGQLIRFDAETGAIRPYGANAFIDYSDAQSGGAIGVGLDNDGQPWVNNNSGNMVRIDNATGAVLKSSQQAAGLYTYSDFTGYQLRNFTAPRGTYRRDFTGCDDETEWRTLSWDATTPANTTLTVVVKVANTIAELSLPTAARYGPFTTSPIDLMAQGVVKRKYLRVEFTLASADRVTTPVLRQFQVTSFCGVMIQ
ncbi:MAG: hypothetical protein Q8N26_34160 [Myxococcales bacterium]|nr:hypothetical protein [Myxococcales bacterium]